MKKPFFRLAKLISKKSDHPKHQIGAVVVSSSGKVISVGVNRLKTNPNSPHPFRTTHAELDAILDCKFFDLKGATIYLYREVKDGTLANSFPCIHCEELLKQHQFKYICYSDDGTFKKKRVANADREN